MTRNCQTTWVSLWEGRRMDARIKIALVEAYSISLTKTDLRSLLNGRKLRKKLGPLFVALFPPESKSGVCRICGYTKDSDCYSPRSWAEPTQTLCDDPKCLALAGWKKQEDRVRRTRPVAALASRDGMPASAR